MEVFVSFSMNRKGEVVLIGPCFSTMEGANAYMTDRIAAGWDTTWIGTSLDGSEPAGWIHDKKHHLEARAA